MTIQNVSSHGFHEWRVSADLKNAVLTKGGEPASTANTARKPKWVPWSQMDEELLFFLDRGCS